MIFSLIKSIIIMNMVKIKNLRPLLIYMLLVQAFLVGLLFIVQTKFSFWLCFLLMILYSILMLYTNWESKHKSYNKMHTIEQLSQSNRPRTLEYFEREAHNIMATLRAEKQYQNGENRSYEDNYYNSPYSLINSSRTNLATSIKTLSPQQGNQIEENKFMMSYCNNTFWKRQLKEVYDNFLSNMKQQRDTSQNSIQSEQYQNFVYGLGLNKNKLAEAETFIQQFLLDRLRKMMEEIQPAISEVNTIVSQHFEMTLVNGQTSNHNQLSLEQLKDITKFYSNYKILPQKYASKYSVDRVNMDMQKLCSMERKISSLIHFPEELQAISITVYILQQQFPTEVLEINKPINNYRKLANITTVMIYPDYSTKISVAPNLRIKNCRKIALIYMLTLIKKRAKVQSNVLKQLKSLTN